MPKTTRREIEQFSACTNASGRLSVASRQSSPITPPWTTATARAAPARSHDDLLEAPARTRALKSARRLGAGHHVPALLGQHAQRVGVAALHADAKLAALPFAEEDLAQPGDGAGLAGRLRAPAAPPSGRCASARC